MQINFLNIVLSVKFRPCTPPQSLCPHPHGPQQTFSTLEKEVGVKSSTFEKTGRESKILAFFTYLLLFPTAH